MKGTLISSVDARRSFWHQKITTPFFMSNVSVLICFYHIHDAETGEYTIILSSKGNEGETAAQMKIFGSDQIGDVKINALRFTPVKNEDGSMEEIKCTHVLVINTPKAPSMIVNRISKTHTTML
jgi:hypothetical protein